jgi:hypothetical protein
MKSFFNLSLNQDPSEIYETFICVMTSFNECLQIYIVFPSMIQQGWHMLWALQPTKNLFFKRIFSVASHDHLVMCLWETLTDFDVSLFTLFG